MRETAMGEALRAEALPGVRSPAARGQAADELGGVGAALTGMGGPLAAIGEALTAVSDAIEPPRPGARREPLTALGRPWRGSTSSP